jgi:hypothetical protein
MAALVLVSLLCPSQQICGPRGWLCGWRRSFPNHTASREGGLALMEDKVKKQVAILELQHMFVLSGNSALRTHIPNIAIFAHQDPRMKVASCKHLEGVNDTT